jgi:tetratricopeptide (TPR) repeat protein
VAIKRNRWVVGSILFIAVFALLALSIGPFLGSAISRNSSQNSAPGNAAQSTTEEEQRAELEGLVKGYELVLEREPDNQTALQELVKARVALGDLAGAVDPLERLAKLNPDVPNYAVLLGQTKQQLGDLEGAAQVYRSVLTANPGNMEALQGLVALLIDQQRPQAAIGLLQDTLKTSQQANEIEPGSIDGVSVKLLLGQVYADQKRYQDAIATYDSAIEDTETLQATKGPDFRPTLAKALVLREMGKEDEAQPLFEMALSLAPAQFQDRIQQMANQGKPAESSPESGASNEEVAPDAASAESTEAPAATGEVE